MNVYRYFRIVGKVLLLIILLWTDETAAAATLPDRLQQFPTWPVVTELRTTGELAYPQWLTGEWLVTSVLKEQVAPLAPEIVSSGFERSRQDLGKPYRFRVRFGSSTTAIAPGIEVRQEKATGAVRIDRAFNIEQIANAYLGANAVESVRAFRQPEIVQITKLRDGTVLRAIVTGYRSESSNPDQFIATEVQNQIFQGRRTTANTVETLTNYFLKNSQQITADQITATYLSPQDPDFFRAAGRPVTLYRYQLKLQAVNQANDVID